MYAQDYDETYTVDAWSGWNFPEGRNAPCSRDNPNIRAEAKVNPYVKSSAIFSCPSSTKPGLVTWDAAKARCSWQAWGYPDFMCYPGDTANGKPMSYGWNAFVFWGVDGSGAGNCSVAPVTMAMVRSPAGKIMMGDACHFQMDFSRLTFPNYPSNSAAGASNAKQFWPGLSNGTGAAIVPETHSRHSLGVNIAFLDGHAKWMPYSRFTGDHNAVYAQWFDYKTEN
jgi:prepilin-type processing-associated H-X9-DG protein